MEDLSSDAKRSANIHVHKKPRIDDKTRYAIVDFVALDCPICFEPLSTPVFQCDNGHLVCSACCPKLSNKCPSCESSIGHIRCRAIESVLESIFVSCPNKDFGCSKKITYGDVSTHEKECIFSPFSCPMQDCDYTASYNCLYDHCNASHFDWYLPFSNKFSVFRCGVSFGLQMELSDIKIMMEDRKRLLFAMQSFKESCGVYVTVSVIAPSSLDIGKFSYNLSYMEDGHILTYESPDLRRIQEVSLERPRDNFMLIPSSLPCGGMLKVTIRDLNQKSKKVAAK